MIKWYEESEGVTSSKRIAGAIVLGIGLIMKVAEFILCLFKSEIIPNIAQADNVSTSVLTIGTVVFMGTVPENIAGCFRKDEK